MEIRTTSIARPRSSNIIVASVFYANGARFFREGCVNFLVSSGRNKRSFMQPYGGGLSKILCFPLPHACAYCRLEEQVGPPMEGRSGWRGSESPSFTQSGVSANLEPFSLPLRMAAFAKSDGCTDVRGIFSKMAFDPLQ